MTIVYVTILDTFTPYDATFAIVRIMVFGFCLLGLLYFDRLRSAEGVRVSQKARLNWFLPMLALVLVSASLGASLPKSDPKWPDPVPFLKRSRIKMVLPGRIRWDIVRMIRRLGTV